MLKFFKSAMFKNKVAGMTPIFLIETNLDEIEPRNIFPKSIESQLISTWGISAWPETLNRIGFAPQIFTVIGISNFPGFSQVTSIVNFKDECLLTLPLGGKIFKISVKLGVIEKTPASSLSLIISMYSTVLTPREIKP